MKTLTSAIDKSVNFILESGQEARYVRREEEYFIVYLSSHNGCNKACRFCHLTQTNQTDYTETTLTGFVEQASMVLMHYKSQVDLGYEPAAERVNFNWMARGEPLDNSVVTGDWERLVRELTALCHSVGLSNINFNISTIVPTTYRGAFVFGGDVQPHIYYSLYSLDEKFRKRWLPKASSPLDVMDALVSWQARVGGLVTLHWAMIQGENDSEQDVEAIAELVMQKGLVAKFNLVRYNPFSGGQGEESDESVLAERFKSLSHVMKMPGSRIVPRVGFDVKASCGMFVSKKEINGQG